MFGFFKHHKYHHVLTMVCASLINNNTRKKTTWLFKTLRLKSAHGAQLRWKGQLGARDS